MTQDNQIWAQAQACYVKQLQNTDGVYDIKSDDLDRNIRDEANGTVEGEFCDKNSSKLDIDIGKFIIWCLKNNNRDFLYALRDRGVVIVRPRVQKFVEKSADDQITELFNRFVPTPWDQLQKEYVAFNAYNSKSDATDLVSDIAAENAGETEQEPGGFRLSVTNFVIDLIEKRDWDKLSLLAENGANLVRHRAFSACAHSDQPVQDLEALLDVVGGDIPDAVRDYQFAHAIQNGNSVPLGALIDVFGKKAMDKLFLQGQMFYAIQHGHDKAFKILKKYDKGSLVASSYPADLVGQKGVSPLLHAGKDPEKYHMFQTMLMEFPSGQRFLQDPNKVNKLYAQIRQSRQEGDVTSAPKKEAKKSAPRARGPKL